MDLYEQQPTRQASATVLCAGHNRFGKPCTNQVRADGGFCGRCTGSRLAPKPVPEADAADRPSPPERQKLRSPVPAPASPVLNDWTVANELIERLTPFADGDAELLSLIEVGARLAENSRAGNTKASYRQHYRTFETFGATYGLDTTPPVDPAVIAYFVAYLEHAGRLDRATGERTGEALSHGYVRQAISAIGHRHTINGLDNPTEDPIVRGMLDGHAKKHGTDQDGKDPIRSADLTRIITTLSEPHPTAGRDLAVCLLATHPDLHLTAGVIARLDGEHLQIPAQPDEAMTILVSRRGTRALTPIEIAPENDGAICTVGALRALDPAPFGPVFRSSPTARLTRNGIQRIISASLDRSGLATTPAADGSLSTDDRRRLSASFPNSSPDDIRDRALITNLYWGCFRASELTQRDWRHLKIVDEGIEWTIPKDKTNQEGRQRRVTGVPRHNDPFLCPVLAIEEWRTHLETLLDRPVRATDPVFPTLDRRTRLTAHMSVQAASHTVQQAAQRAGLDGDYGSHSLRSGFTTDALDANVTRDQVKHHGGWRNSRSLDPYIRKSATWARTNPAIQMINREP